MKFYDPRHTPDTSGTLHEWSNETANCGMGAIANLRGEKSYDIIDYALTSVCNMTHRGAVDADMKTGDGSGMSSARIPRPLFAKVGRPVRLHRLTLLTLPSASFFLPGDDTANCSSQYQNLRYRVRPRTAATSPSSDGAKPPSIPTNSENSPRTLSPEILHLLASKPNDWDGDHFERQLFLVRREIEKEFEDVADFYIPTLSGRLISYKGLAMPATLRAFYSDLQDSDFQTGISLYHQRFSTNTFPAWPLGQPFRMMCHNGEINTVRGNRNWMASREEFFESDIWGGDVDLLKNLMRAGESDSSSLDHALELLVLSGRPIEQAMCMLVPPAFRYDQDISESVRGFYNYHRSFSEPWDGPAGLVFTDGIKICAGLDRNGLRPSRYTLTQDGLLYIGSESGAVVLPNEKVIRRGRLGPGR